MSGIPKNLKEIVKDEYAKCAKNPAYFMKRYAKIQHPTRGKMLFDGLSFHVVSNTNRIMIRVSHRGFFIMARLVLPCCQCPAYRGKLIDGARFTLYAGIIPDVKSSSVMLFGIFSASSIDIKLTDLPCVIDFAPYIL
jgi:hypothetical protein